MNQPAGISSVGADVRRLKSLQESAVLPLVRASLGLVQEQMRSSGFRPASVERKSVERRSAFEVTTLYAQTLHALRVLAGHNVRITPKVWKLFLHEL